jgi:hypothetical protein
MSGVGLVGFSGSLIKNAIKEPIVSNLLSTLIGARADLQSPEAVEAEPTTVLVGE